MGKINEKNPNICFLFINKFDAIQKISKFNAKKTKAQKHSFPLKLKNIHSTYYSNFKIPPPNHFLKLQF